MYCFERINRMFQKTSFNDLPNSIEISKVQIVLIYLNVEFLLYTVSSIYNFYMRFHINIIYKKQYDSGLRCHGMLFNKMKLSSSNLPPSSRRPLAFECQSLSQRRGRGARFLFRFTFYETKLFPRLLLRSTNYGTKCQNQAKSTLLNSMK